MVHFSFIIRSRINRSGSKSGKHNFGRSRTRHQHSSRRRETAEDLTSFRAKHTTLFFCLALPSNNLFQIQMMCIGPYMQYFPLVPVADLKNAAIVGSSWALVTGILYTLLLAQLRWLRLGYLFLDHIRKSTQYGQLDSILWWPQRMRDRIEKTWIWQNASVLVWGQPRSEGLQV